MVPFTVEILNEKLHLFVRYTAQKMKFCIKDFLSKCDQIPGFLQIWSHLLMKSLMENFIFCCCAVVYAYFGRACGCTSPS